MNSELVRFLLSNADKLGLGDLLILIVVIAAVLGSAIGTLHWIYKHAFEKQKEVIQSQDKLIELKNQAIAEYVSRVDRLAVEKDDMASKVAAANLELDRAMRQISESSASQEKSKAEEAKWILRTAEWGIAAFCSRRLYFWLAWFQNLHALVDVYGAVCIQHSDRTGESPWRLARKIKQSERAVFDSYRWIYKEHVNAGEFFRDAKDFMEGSKSENTEARRLEEYVVPAVLPVLEKYEPDLGKRVRGEYEKRSNAESSTQTGG